MMIFPWWNTFKHEISNQAITIIIRLRDNLGERQNSITVADWFTYHFMV